MKKQSIKIIALTLLQILPLSAALFSGSGSTDYTFRLANSHTPQGQSELTTNNFFGFGTGIRTITADLNPGTLSSTIIETEFEGSQSFPQNVINVTDLTTFESEMWTTQITINSIVSYVELGSAPIIQPNSALIAIPPVVSGAITIEGSYEIVGPSTTVTENFSIADTIPVSGGPVLILSNFNIPNSFDLGEQVFEGLSFFQNNPVIFDTVVDGLSLSSSFGSGVVEPAGDDTFFGDNAITLTSIPEPSSSALLACVCFCSSFKRRRS